MGLFYRFSGVTEEVLSEKDLLGTYKRVSISKKAIVWLFVRQQLEQFRLAH